MAIGRLSPSTPVYMTSGESTQSDKLPDKFKSTPVAPSPISSQLVTPAEFRALAPGTVHTAVVREWPRTNGMRYLYARGATRMPIHRLGADGQPYPWRSGFQPNDMGPIRNGGFNDKLFQAGYPGFNLGLSFKVPSINTMEGPRTNFTSPITISQTRKVNPYGRT